MGGRGEMRDGWGVGGLVEVFLEGYKSRFLNPGFFSDSLSGADVCARGDRVNRAGQLFIGAPG